MVECFFFVESVDGQEGTIRALCVDHGRLHKGSWFYSGQVGPWTIKCYHCNKVIHLHEENENETTS